MVYAGSCLPTRSTSRDCRCQKASPTAPRDTKERCHTNDAQLLHKDVGQVHYSMSKRPLRSCLVLSAVIIQVGTAPGISTRGRFVAAISHSAARGGGWDLLSSDTQHRSEGAHRSGLSPAGKRSGASRHGRGGRRRSPGTTGTRSTRTEPGCGEQGRPQQSHWRASRVTSTGRMSDQESRQSVSCPSVSDQHHVSWLAATHALTLSPKPTRSVTGTNCTSPGAEHTSICAQAPAPSTPGSCSGHRAPFLGTSTPPSEGDLPPPTFPQSSRTPSPQPDRVEQEQVPEVMEERGADGHADTLQAWSHKPLERVS